MEHHSRPDPSLSRANERQCVEFSPSILLLRFSSLLDVSDGVLDSVLIVFDASLILQVSFAEIAVNLQQKIELLVR